MGKLRIGRASEEAAGIPAIWNTMVYGIGEAGPIRSAEAFLKINQVTGFDCQSCAWPSPDKKRKVFEFCENGAKAVSDESTKKRIGPEFFARHSIADLAAQSDYWLNEQGRLTSPMVRNTDATHYQPITWPEAFAMIAEELHRLESPEQASFLATGILFWSPVIRPLPKSLKWPESSILLYLFLATLPCDILSGFLVFCERVVYPVFLSSPNSFGLSALEDQQCAGALMWTCVTFVYVIAGTVFTARLLSPHRAEDGELGIPHFDSRSIAVRHTNPHQMEAV
jgi:hypothetical protein